MRVKKRLGAAYWAHAHPAVFARLPQLCATLLLLSLSGCDGQSGADQTASTGLSPEAIATRDALPEDVFKGELNGQPVYLLLHDCEVFSVQPLPKGEVRWESVLAPEPYPFFTACERQRMRRDSGRLTVTLGRRAFGAGGCCATGGTYRSADGRRWKKIA